MERKKTPLVKADLIVNDLSEIELKKLWEIGFRGIFLDLDNTITPWHAYEVSPKAERFVNQARDLGYKLCLLSNASEQRTKAIAGALNIPFLAPALKPLKRSYRKALSIIRLDPQQVMAIGDQIFTDILGGNRIGCYTILVPPLSKTEFPGTKILRLMESIIGCRRGAD